MLHEKTGNLVNAQTEVNRSVWAANHWHNHNTISPDDYIQQCVESAIKDLTIVLKFIKKRKLNNKRNIKS